MKKIIIIVVLCFFCTSCSNVSKTVHTKLNPSQIEPIQQVAYCTYVFAACSKEAFYYQSSGGMLFVLDQDGNNMQLGSLNFVDDKPAGSSRNGIPASKYYSEMAGIGVGMQYFDDQLIYESEYSSSDGQIQYHLNSIDKTCSRFQTILSFDYQPSYFTLQNDVIAVAETIAENSGGVVHLFSLDGKELKKYEHHSNVVRITSNGNDIVIFCDGCMYAINTISLEERILDEQENTAFLYLDGNRVAYCEYSPIDGTTALNVNAGIKNIKTGEVLFTKEDVIVDYFDDQYIYAATIKEEHTKYLIYDWNGDLVKEIIPYDDLGKSKGAFPVAMNEMEYSNIVRVWNNQIIGNHFTDTEIELFACDIETGKCHFLMN